MEYGPKLFQPEGLLPTDWYFPKENDKLTLLASQV